MRSHEARAEATRAQHDHDTSTRAVGRTTLTGQLAYDDDDQMFAGVPWGNIAADDADGSDGDGVEGGPVKVDGGGGMVEAPDGEHDQGAEHGKGAEHGAKGEPDADGDATEAESGDSASGDRDASHTAEDGFRDHPVELPHRIELEQLFGMSFAGVRAYTGRHARQATRALGASAYTVGNRIAFASPNPSREVVAHELTHVVQHDASPTAKGSGIETAGEHEAEQVEAAVAAGQRPRLAHAARPHGGGHHGFAASHRRAPNLKANPKFGIGMTFLWPTMIGITAEQFPRGGNATRPRRSSRGPCGRRRTRSRSRSARFPCSTSSSTRR